MTALTAILGLLPAALSTRIGSQTQQPLAIVVVGGMATALFLTGYLMPLLYTFYGQREPPRLLRRPGPLIGPAGSVSDRMLCVSSGGSRPRLATKRRPRLATKRCPGSPTPAENSCRQSFLQFASSATDTTVISHHVSPIVRTRVLQLPWPGEDAHLYGRVSVMPPRRLLLACAAVERLPLARP